MATKSNLTILKENIKEKRLLNLYLFFGDEIYLKETYINRVKSAINIDSFPEFNDIKLEDNTFTLNDIDAVFDSYPMMTDKKFVLIKNSGIFKSPKEDIKDFWLSRLNDIPEYLYVIFSEKDVDKRSATYKSVVKNGMAVEFEYLKEAELVAWVGREFLKAGKKIDKSVITYFISICDSGLSDIKNEMDKLIHYCDKEILKSDVDRLVSKSLQIRIFEITDCIMKKNAEHAMTVLSELKTNKEPAFKILYLLSGAFNKMLHCKLLLENSSSYDEIANKLNIRPFLVRTYADGAKQFSEQFLISRVIRTAEIDFDIKQGLTNEWTALEQYVAEAIYNKK